MNRRNFFATSLVAGAAGGTGLLSACAPRTGVAGSAPAPGGIVRPLRLSSNENPLGLGPAARRAILETLGEANRYPREPRTALVAALAAKHGVAPGNVALGTGSTEVLQMAVQATPREAVVIAAEPTFEDVPDYAETAGRRVVRVALRPDGSHDIGRMREEASRAGTALVFLCNPNNPTGTLTPCADIEAWIGESDDRTTFVVDEAYFEFVEDARYRSAERLAAARTNVIVIRTFSKIHGMAGLRIGYALAHVETVRRLRAWECGVNVNIPGLFAARAALDDTAHQRRSLEANRAGRRLVERTLDELNLEHLPSHANFVMHRIPGEVRQYITRMREREITVGRPFPPMLGWNRVSIGTMAEMEVFVGELRAFRRLGWV